MAGSRHTHAHDPIKLARAALVVVCAVGCGPAPVQSSYLPPNGLLFDAQPADTVSADMGAAETIAGLEDSDDGVPSSDDADETAAFDDVAPPEDPDAPAPPPDAMDDATVDGEAADADPMTPDADAPAPADGSADVPTASDAATTDASAADTTPAWKPPTGGAPGSSCAGQEGTVACSLDGKFRVECNNGAWMALQHCGFGVCSAQLSAGGAVVTTCAVPDTAMVELNTACARYTQCFGGVSHETCVRANLLGAAWSGNFTAGSTHTVAQVALAHLQGNLACAAKANSCSQLAACIYLFATPTCQVSASGCEGQVAWQCSGGTALGANCAMLGMKCAVFQGVGQCVQAPACAVPASVACNGNTASQCVAAVDGKAYALTRDCNATGGGCKAGVASLSGGCSGPPPVTCTSQGFAASCSDGKTKNCAAGVEQAAACPFGTSCAVQNDFELLLPVCPPGQICTKATCTEGGSCAMAARCNGSEVWFCQAKQPVAFDCKTIGASCQAGVDGPLCK